MGDTATDDDLTYYARRAREERDRALIATDHDSAAAHKAMADRYDWLLRHRARHRPDID